MGQRRKREGRRSLERATFRPPRMLANRPVLPFMACHRQCVLCRIDPASCFGTPAPRTKGDRSPEPSPCNHAAGYDVSGLATSVASEETPPCRAVSCIWVRAHDNSLRRTTRSETPKNLEMGEPHPCASCSLEARPPPEVRPATCSGCPAPPGGAILARPEQAVLVGRAGHRRGNRPSLPCPPCSVSIGKTSGRLATERSRQPCCARKHLHPTIGRDPTEEDSFPMGSRWGSIAA